MSNKHTKKEPIVQGWAAIESHARNAVVQVFSQSAKFNWLQPYDIDAQYENSGTGFFIHEDGYIITCAHVVEEAKSVWIQVPALGMNVIHVDIIGFCPARDLVSLKVRPDDVVFLRSELTTIPVLKLGDSDTVVSTENVLVLGYPLGESRLKSTTGVVSGRESSDEYSYLQVTAPVNPGNSGGPLFNAQGEVIGIAVSMVVAASNVGYAIPVNELRLILQDLYQNKFLPAPILGLAFCNSSDYLAQLFGNPVPSGIYVTSILPNSLLDKAGVRAGDVMYSLNGYALDAYGDTTTAWSSDKVSLRDLVGRLVIGDMVTIVVYRQGKKIEVTFPFKYGPLYPIREIYPDYEPVDYETIGGLVIMQLAENHIPLLAEVAPDLLQYLKMEHRSDSVLLVTHIMPGSCAHEQRNIMVGSLIEQVNGVPVGTLAGLREQLTVSLKTGFLTIKSRDSVLAVYPFQEILQDELRLSQLFMYPVSPKVRELLAFFSISGTN